jgi:hypothetical protein
VDAEIHGRPFDGVEIPKDATADDLAKAAKALEAYREWRDVYDIEIVDTETAVVSEVHGFGGTWDAIARTRKHGRLFLLDWKSSNAVYREYILQVAAYREARPSARLRSQRGESRAVWQDACRLSTPLMAGVRAGYRLGGLPACARALPARREATGRFEVKGASHNKPTEPRCRPMAAKLVASFAQTAWTFEHVEAMAIACATASMR